MLLPAEERAAGFCLGQHSQDERGGDGACTSQIPALGMVQPWTCSRHNRGAWGLHRAQEKPYSCSTPGLSSGALDHQGSRCTQVSWRHVFTDAGRAREGGQFLPQGAVGKQADAN